MIPDPVRNQVFISYSHRDKEWLERLQIFLRPLEREGKIQCWDDTRIQPGQKWQEEIEKALASACMVILLVSADFMASDFIANNELQPLLAAAEAEGVIILPVILSSSRFPRTPSLSRFQALNPLDKPLLGMSIAEREAQWQKLTDTIEDILANPL